MMCRNNAVHSQRTGAAADNRCTRNNVMRREELIKQLKSRRRRKIICASDDDSTSDDPRSMRIPDAVGMMEPKDIEDHPWRNRNIVTTTTTTSSSSSPLHVTADAIGTMETMDKEDPWRSKRNNIVTTTSSPLHVTASTASMSMSFDTSFNSSIMEVKSSVMEGWAPEKDQRQTPDNYWNQFDDNDDEFAAITPTWLPFDDKVEGGASASPVSVNDIDSFTRKRFDKIKTSQSSSVKKSSVDKTKTSQSSSVKKSSVHDDVLRSLREENERLKNLIREAREEEGTLDAAAGTLLFDESSSSDGAAARERTLFTSFDEGYIGTVTVDDGTPTTTDLYTIDEGAADEGAVADKGTLATSVIEGAVDTVDTSAILETFEVAIVSGTVDELTNILDAVESEADWEEDDLEDDLDLESELDSVQGKSGIITSTCTALYDELMGTYEDTNNAFSQVFNAFAISLDDFDEMTDVILGVKKELKKSHTDEFVSKKGWGSKSAWKE
jgi:hypothetical protein